jgi:hypothetical protein
VGGRHEALVKDIKKDGKPQACHLSKNDNLIDQTRLMATAATATGGPQVKEIQPLDFHERPVDQEIISEHNDQRDNEVGNGFRGYKWSSFILNFRHEISISPLKVEYFGADPLAPNGCEPVEKPKTENDGPKVNPRSCFFFKFL